MVVFVLPLHFKLMESQIQILSRVSLKVVTVVSILVFLACVSGMLTLAIIFNANYTFSYSACYTDQDFDDYLTHMDTLSLVLVEMAAMFPFGGYFVLMIVMVSYSFRRIKMLREWQERNPNAVDSV